MIKINTHTDESGKCCFLSVYEDSCCGDDAKLTRVYPPVTLTPNGQYWNLVGTNGNGREDIFIQDISEVEIDGNEGSIELLDMVVCCLNDAGEYDPNPCEEGFAAFNIAGWEQQIGAVSETRQDLEGWFFSQEALLSLAGAPAGSIISGYGFGMYPEGSAVPVANYLLDEGLRKGSGGKMGIRYDGEYVTGDAVLAGGARWRKKRNNTDQPFQIFLCECATASVEITWEKCPDEVEPPAECIPVEFEILGQGETGILTPETGSVFVGAACPTVTLTDAGGVEYVWVLSTESETAWEYIAPAGQDLTGDTLLPITVLGCDITLNNGVIECPACEIVNDTWKFVSQPCPENVTAQWGPDFDEVYFNIDFPWVFYPNNDTANNSQFVTLVDENGLSTQFEFFGANDQTSVYQGTLPANWFGATSVVFDSAENVVNLTGEVCPLDGSYDLEPYEPICTALTGNIGSNNTTIKIFSVLPFDFRNLNTTSGAPNGCDSITLTDQNGDSIVWTGGSLIIAIPSNLPPYLQVNYTGATIPNTFVGPLEVTFNCAEQIVNNAPCVTLEVDFTPIPPDICDCPTISYTYACWCGANGSAVPNNGTLNTYLATYTGNGTVQLADLALRQKGTSNFAVLGLVQDSAGQAIWVENSSLANPNGLNVYTLEGTDSNGILFSIDFEIIPNATGFKRAYAGINFSKANIPSNCSTSLPSVDEYFHIFSTPLNGVGFGDLELGLNEYEMTAQSESPFGTILTSKQSILVECSEPLQICEIATANIDPTGTELSISLPIGYTFDVPRTQFITLTSSTGEERIWELLGGAYSGLELGTDFDNPITVTFNGGQTATNNLGEQCIVGVGEFSFTPALVCANYGYGFNNTTSIYSVAVGGGLEFVAPYAELVATDSNGMEWNIPVTWLASTPNIIFYSFENPPAGFLGGPVVSTAYHGIPIDPLCFMSAIPDAPAAPPTFNCNSPTITPRPTTLTGTQSTVYIDTTAPNGGKIVFGEGVIASIIRNQINGAICNYYLIAILRPSDNAPFWFHFGLEKAVDLGLGNGVEIIDLVDTPAPCGKQQVADNFELARTENPNVLVTSAGINPASTLIQAGFPLDTLVTATFAGAAVGGTGMSVVCISV